MTHQIAAGLRHSRQDIGTDSRCRIQLLVYQSVKAGDKFLVSTLLFLLCLSFDKQ